MEERSRGK